MKKSRFLLLCLVLLSLGCLGRWLLRPPAAKCVPYTLTLTADSLDAFLCPSLPAVGEEIRVGNTRGKVTAVTAQPKVLIYRREGETLRVPSTLLLSRLFIFFFF